MNYFEKSKIVRSMVEHENTLLNNRINWMFTGQSFLILSTRLFWEENLMFVLLISIFGILSSLSFHYTIKCSLEAIEALIKNYWDADPPVIGYRLTLSKPSANENFLIWKTLPILIIIFWFFILFGSIYSYYQRCTN